eukprot:scaffold5168_cov73-Cylindrotheca_fusiformis.AAC.3
MVKRVLLLHGNRQTGQLLLGRLERMQKRLSKECNDDVDGMDLVVPDAPFPHPEDDKLRTWWHRVDNAYEGLEESLEILKGLQNDHDDVVGIMGFSQGARLAHLVV